MTDEVVELSAVVAGNHTLDWNGITPSGTSAPGGVYAIRVRLENAVHTHFVMEVRN